MLFPLYRLVDQLARNTLGLPTVQRMTKDVALAKRVATWRKTHGGKPHPKSMREMFGCARRRSVRRIG